MIALGDKVWWWERNSNQRGRRSHPERGVVVNLVEGERAWVLKADSESPEAVLLLLSRLRLDDR